MSVSFSRTLQTLQQQSWGHTWLLLPLVGVLLGLWLAWFLLFPMVAWERAVSLTLQNSSQALAIFPAAALRHLQTGQSAQVRLDDFPAAEYGTVTATVTDVDTVVQEGHIQVKLHLLNNPHSPIPRQRGLTGSAEVEVGKMTPAQLLWQTLRQSPTAADSPDEATP